MTLTVIALDNKENFLQFLDPDLISLTETIEYAGLRTLKVEYTFQDLVEDKELFRIGNKLWVQGDSNLSDCLYVINTPVEVDIFNENQFTFEIEEVLVELNYAPLFSQTELTSANGFRINNTNSAVEVYVDWNSLNYWFGKWFNIGVVQDCLSTYASKISISGTLTRMQLLRKIEEETGNVFVTRYEKDCLNNTIHRYLDFLNPINAAKNWTLTLQYDFIAESTNIPCWKGTPDNEVAEDQAQDVHPFEDGIPAESLPEIVSTDLDDGGDNVERSYEWIPEDETVEDYYIDGLTYEPLINLNPEACQFQICDENSNVLGSDGKVYETGSEATPLSWDCDGAGLVDIDHTMISLQRLGKNLCITINESSYIVQGATDVSTAVAYNQELRDEGHITPADDNEIENVVLPDDCYLEIYDYSIHRTLFRTKLDTKIGTVHTEVLDFGYNLENIEYEIDETETYSAISPVLGNNTNSATDNKLNRNDIATIINRWNSLSIGKGQVIPMIVEKINVSGTDLNNAKSKLGTYNLSNNYWIRPLKPNDNIDSTDKQFEFFKAKAYWRAPYAKKAGELHVSTDTVIERQYRDIMQRPDTRGERGAELTPKMGTTESTDEDIYSIYNQVALYLKAHEQPTINITLDVANLREQNQFNNYQLHDKIYIKMPNTGELLTARVTKTTKEAHDIAKNSIEISNYKTINTAKITTQETFINATNINFKYPQSKTFTAQLVNSDYDPLNPDSINYPAGKLITMTLYKIENGSSTWTGKTYSKITDIDGKVSLSMKYDPGDYELEITFAGDEEYLESTLTIKINVGGTKTVAKKTNTNTKKTKSKTTKKTKTKTKTKYKTVKEYWTKCGLSPDKEHKKLVSIAMPSGPDAGRYSYTWYKTVFKNYCPICNTWGTLRFDGGSANKCIESEGAYGRGYKVGVPEHEITCNKCDSDYCGVTGAEKWYTVRGRLKTVEDPKRSSEGEFNKLVKGKLLYGTKKVKIKEKKNVSTKTRKIRADNISNRVKKLALSIVGNKTGKWAAWAIVEWMDRNIAYSGYPNFIRSPDEVLNRGSGNCCDQTRLCFQLLDAAGCTEFYDMYYVHVTGHVYGMLTTKSSGNSRYVDCASDYHGAWGYVCQGYPRGSPTSKYPNLPF